MGNPNDFAMNMVTFLPFAVFTALGRDRTPKRLLATGIAILMLAAIVFTKSRAGMLGLAVTGLVMLLQAGRFRARLVAALIVGSLVAVPLRAVVDRGRGCRASSTRTRTPPGRVRPARI